MKFEFAKEAQEELKKLSDTKISLMRHFGKKVYIGHEKREGWRGELPFYLFWCEACGHFAKDYPHGFTENQYMNCSHCDVRHDFTPWWVAWSQLWDLVKFSLKNR